MAEWTGEATEYLDGYLGRVAVLLRRQGDNSEEVVAGMRDHILNELASEGGETISLDRLLQVVSDLGTPEEVASPDSLPPGLPAATKIPRTEMPA